MGNIFAGSEVVELGIQIEKNGRDFYTALTRQSKDTGVIKIFTYLAEEEQKHIAVFQGILDSLEEYQPPESYPGEYFAYMRALASEYVFTQRDAGAKVAKDIKSDREAVDFAIGFEKDSIVFYQGMKRIVPEHDLKPLDALIAQEEGHLQNLLELKKEILKRKGGSGG